MSGRDVLRVLVMLLCGTLSVAAPSASAWQVSEGPAGLVVTAQPGEANDLFVSSGPALEIDELGPAPRSGSLPATCTELGPRTVSCDDPRPVTVDAGDGDDAVTVTGARATTVLGGPGDDELIGGGEGDALDGGEGRDAIRGGPGADALVGAAGDDDLAGGDGVDVLDGGDGADALVGGAGADRLAGAAGADALSGGDDADTLAGGDGADMLAGGDGDDALNGGDGDDALAGGDGDDALNGNAGDDALTADGGADVLDGGPDADRLAGGAGPDALAGGDGADSLDGGDGNDALGGDGGDDALDGGAGADDVAGGGGADTVSYARSPAAVAVTLDEGSQDGASGEGDRVRPDVERLVGSAFDDRLVAGDAARVLVGGSGDDALVGGGGADELDGGDGDDTMIGGLGPDRMAGGDGQDTASYAERRVAVTVAAGDGAPDGAAGEGDLVAADVERLAGGAGSDTLTGRVGLADVLDGGDGDDLLTATGDAARDIVQCGLGADDARIDGEDGAAPDCERLSVDGRSVRPADPPRAWIGNRLLRLRPDRTARLQMTCGVRSKGRCAVSGAVSAMLGGRRVRLARVRSTIAPGATSAITLRVAPVVVRMLRRRAPGGIWARLQVDVRDALGRSSSVRRRVRVVEHRR